MEVNEELKLKVWEKATTENGYDSQRFRKDVCGAWIKYDKYGDRSDIYGWEIDHVYPKAKVKDCNQLDNLINLRPMQWQNNASKGDNYPEYQSAVRSKDNQNITEEMTYTVNDELQQKLNALFNI